MCSVISTSPTIDIPTDLTYRPIQHVQCHFSPPQKISQQTLHTDRYNMCSVISSPHNRYHNKPYIQTDTTCAVSFHPHHNRYPDRPYIHTDTTCAVSFHPHHNRYPNRPYIQTDTTCAVEIINCTSNRIYTTHKKFTSLFCIPYILLLIVMGFQNIPQNINEKKKTQGKTLKWWEDLVFRYS